VLAIILKGLLNKRIALNLLPSRQTVKAYVSGIPEQLGARNRIEVITNCAANDWNNEMIKSTLQSGQEHVARLSDISPSGQIRLLDLSYARIAFGFSLIPVVATPFIVWLHQIGRDARAFWVWAGVFTLVALAVRFLFRRYRRDCAQLGAERAMRDWLPKVHALALLYGFSLSVPVLIMSS